MAEPLTEPQVSPPPESARGLWQALRAFFRDRFNLQEDRANEHKTIEEIERSVEFRGANLWILMFAIMVCSVGLNVNSTPVVIGAMLISPLMGPIMGVGLGMGIFDQELIVKSLKNLGVAVLISVLTSALYFLITPLQEAQSELLSRTQPTLWDVLIAFFGGLAGIVAGSRKEKSNAIPGVAIATALMPPLCTAGYGLATAQWNYFFGASYLFFINSVFISVATWLIVRALGFHLKEYVDKERERRVRRFVLLLAVATMIPSVPTAIRVVRATVFERNARTFVQNELQRPGSLIVQEHFVWNSTPPRIEVAVIGDPLPAEELARARAHLPNYGLAGTELVVRQWSTRDSISPAELQALNERLRTSLLEEFYQKAEKQILQQQHETDSLRRILARIEAEQLPVGKIAAEARAIEPDLMSLSLARSVEIQLDSMRQDTLLLMFARFRKRQPRADLARLEEWLKARTGTPKVRLVVE